MLSAGLNLCFAPNGPECIFEDMGMFIRESIRSASAFNRMTFEQTKEVIFHSKALVGEAFCCTHGCICHDAKPLIRNGNRMLYTVGIPTVII